MFYKPFGVYLKLCIILIIYYCIYVDAACDRRPLGMKSDPLAPDNRFYIEINGIINAKYIPKSKYLVTLKSRDNTSTFIAFTISLQEDSIPNEHNSRKRILLNPGRLEVLPNSTTTEFSHACNNTIKESDITAKTFVEALWTAPDKDNKCVTIFAVVATKPNEWYNYEGPLSKRVCEDRRKAEDMPPMENDNCQACDDARYELTFQGMWSFNTHPEMFPLAHELGRFSDLVGASHSKDYNLYKYTSEASLGLKMLAEQGNTTKLELEIQKKLGKTVRTIIKATAPLKTNMDTVTSFRASREYHLVSLATGLLPSPDWFLGVSNLELCDVKTDQWAESITLNMYPMDAGTDKGLTFESANEEMSPPQPISPLNISKDVKPFAKLHFVLVRTYRRPNCSSNKDAEVSTEEYENRNKNNNTQGGDENTTIVQTTTTSEQTPSVDPESTKECPMSTWDDWLPCEGECVDGTLQGIQIRLRYHMVDGVPIAKYGQNAPTDEEKEVPEHCRGLSLSETRFCEDSCVESEEEEET